MESAAEYIERAKAATKSDSDSNLARKIGVSRQFMSRFKSGERTPSDQVMLRLAERAKLDPDEALILLNFWRAQGEAKAVYARMLKKFTATIAIVFALFSPLASNQANALIYMDPTRVQSVSDHALALSQSNNYATKGLFH